MSNVSLEARVRDDTGKQASKRLRRDGWIPAILYGADTPNVALELRLKTLYDSLKHHAGEHLMVELELEGRKKPVAALMREVQHHPVTGEIVHVDFQKVSLRRRIAVDVPLAFVGVPVGVRNQGGILDHVLRDVEIECLPTHLPERLEVDVSGLGIGQSIHVGDLVFEKGRILTDASQIVATVLAPRIIIEAAPAAEVELEEEEGEATDEQQAP
jgi:large subunit ribosomal protein L25